MFLHTFTPQNRAPQKYVSAIPALNVRRIFHNPTPAIPRDKSVYHGSSAEVFSDFLLYKKDYSGIWIKRDRDLALWDCEILLALPIWLRRGDVYEWEMVEC